MTEAVYQFLRRSGCTFHELRMEDVRPCIVVEQRAFDRLRAAWQQPPQLPRRFDWLAWHAANLPQNVLVLEKDGAAAGWAMVHAWGTLGWVGPVAVDPEVQGLGLGKVLVTWCLEKLGGVGCTTVGLETWAQAADNVGLYLKQGFGIGPLICLVEKESSLADGVLNARRVVFPGQIESEMEALKEMWCAVQPGLDYSVPLACMLACGMGELLVWGNGGMVEAAALLRLQPFTESGMEPSAAVDLLSVRPQFQDRLSRYVEDLSAAAAQSGKRFLRIPAPATDPAGMRLLLDCGFRLVKTRLRMLAADTPQAEGAVNYLSFSV